MKTIWRRTLLKHPCYPHKFGFLFSCHLGLRIQRRKPGTAYSPKTNHHHQPKPKNSGTIPKRGETRGTRDKEELAKPQLRTTRLTRRPMFSPGAASAHLCTRPYFQLTRETQAQVEWQNIVSIDYRMKQVLWIPFGTVETYSREIPTGSKILPI